MSTGEEGGSVENKWKPPFSVLITISDSACNFLGADQLPGTQSPAIIGNNWCNSREESVAGK